jgi:XRE family transcriptional regulator, regulator of sulfur utilization
MPRRAERSPEGKKFGEELRRLRKERQLSQEALAERAGIAADYLGFIERGENVPTLPIMLKLAHALRLNASELLRVFDKRR